MCKKCNDTTHRETPAKTQVLGGYLDTLAQLGTKPEKTTPAPTPAKGKTAEEKAKKAEKIQAVKNEIDEVINFFPELKGKTHISQAETLKKRANRNFLKTNLSKDLILYSIAKANDRPERILYTEGEEIPRKRPRIKKNYLIETEHLKEEVNTNYKLLKSFRNMYYCNNEMIVKPSGQVVSNYCKNRLCIVCNAIRTAVLTEQYKPVFKAFGENAYFVTLTVKNCTGENLNETLDEMQKAFTRIKDRFKKDHSRKEGKKFEGVKKIECTSLRKNDYHPHYHFVIKGEENAQKLYKYWLEDTEKNKVLTAKTTAQDVKKADEGSIKELFKYFTKITSSQKEEEKIHIDRVCTIFEAMTERRVFQSFGFKLSDYTEATPKPEKEDINPLDLPAELFAMKDTDNDKENILELYGNFEKYTERTAPDVMQLIENLHTYQADQNGNFTGIKTKDENEEEQPQSAKEVLNMILESSILEAKQKIIEIDFYKLDTSPPIETPDKYYTFDNKRGNWWNKETGEPLILEYYIPDKIKEATKNIIYPQFMRAKIIEYYKILPNFI